MSTVAALLKIYFARKKKSRPGFSMRTFSKALNVSPSFISDILNGKKQLPLSRVTAIAHILEMDSAAVAQLKKAIARDTLMMCGIDPMEFINETALKKYQPVAKSEFSILSPWYNIAIMDLSTCQNFKKDPQWIAESLGISRYQAEHAIKELIRHELLRETDTGYEKVSEKIRLSLDKSHPDIRNFHFQMMSLAQKELSQKTDLEDFIRREISGITITANPEQIAKAKAKLIESIHEVAEILSQGECTELFQINTQMFSLLNPKKSS